MASQKMTFTIADDVAQALVQRVPSRERSQFVTAAVSDRLEARARRLAASCDAANALHDVALLEDDFDAIEDGISEPWIPN